jgi:hypothetical protein
VSAQHCCRAWPPELDECAFETQWKIWNGAQGRELVQEINRQLAPNGRARNFVNSYAPPTFTRATVSLVGM